MAHHFSTTHRVEFFETDLAGIVHFANYYRFMEQAEHEFFRSLEMKIHGHDNDGIVFGWPRVSATCSFKSPAYYGDVIEVRLTVLRLSRRSLTIAYHFSRDGLELAEGEMKTAYCVIPPGQKLKSSEMPDAEYEKLAKWAGP